MTATALDAPATDRRQSRRRFDLSIMPFYDLRSEMTGTRPGPLTWKVGNLAEVWAERRHVSDRRFVLDVGRWRFHVNVIQTVIIALLAAILVTALTTSVSQTARQLQRRPDIASPQAYYQWDRYYRTSVGDEAQ